MYLTQTELKTHLRDEYAELISRGDDTLLTASIDGAIAQASGYLGDYDTKTIFEANGEQRNPLLLIFVKDIAVYHFINLCGAGSYYERREKRYDGAIAWLKGVQKGIVTPNLPKSVSSAGRSSSSIHIASNAKRGNHF